MRKIGLIIGDGLRIWEGLDVGDKGKEKEWESEEFKDLSNVEDI